MHHGPRQFQLRHLHETVSKTAIDATSSRLKDVWTQDRHGICEGPAALQLDYMTII